MQTLRTFKHTVVVVTILATVSVAWASFVMPLPHIGVESTDGDIFFRGLFADLVKVVATLSVAFMGWMAVKIVALGETQAQLVEDIKLMQENCVRHKEGNK